MGFLKEFKAFAVKGNVMDMAVGVIIGGAFGKIVTSLVNNIIMPPLGVLMGNKDFKDLSVKLQDAKEAVVNADGVEITPAQPEVFLKYGEFIKTCVDFAIIAFSIFVVIRVITRLSEIRKKKEEEVAAAEPAPAPEPTKEETLLTEIRDLLKEKK
jgi:large conductance mechanosensitive channel